MLVGLPRYDALGYDPSWHKASRYAKNQISELITLFVNLAPSSDPIITFTLGLRARCN